MFLGCIFFSRTKFTARSLKINARTIMHRKCQCLLVAPVFAAELLIVFSLLTAYLLARMYREPLESPDFFVINEYLAPGVCLLKAARIVHILFPVPSSEGQMPQNTVLPRN